MSDTNFVNGTFITPEWLNDINRLNYTIFGNPANLTEAQENFGLNNYLPLAGGLMTGVLNMGGNRIAAVSEPTDPQDAATKNYVDTNGGGGSGTIEVEDDGMTVGSGMFSKLNFGANLTVTDTGSGSCRIDGSGGGGGFDPGVSYTWTAQQKYDRSNFGSVLMGTAAAQAADVEGASTYWQGKSINNTWQIRWRMVGSQLQLVGDSTGADVFQSFSPTAAARIAYRQMTPTNDFRWYPNLSTDSEPNYTFRLYGINTNDKGVYVGNGADAGETRLYIDDQDSWLTKFKLLATCNSRSSGSTIVNGPTNPAGQPASIMTRNGAGDYSIDCNNIAQDTWTNSDAGRARVHVNVSVQDPAKFFTYRVVVTGTDTVQIIFYSISDSNTGFDPAGFAVDVWVER